MKFIHTGDWHLGRIFHGVHLTEDQAHVLRQLEDLIKDTRPDFCLIAGDIYDRSIPPSETVDLLNDHWARVVVDLRTPVIVIAGNHDSSQRLGFASRLLKKGGLHIYSKVEKEIAPLILEDKHGDVYLYPIPYADPEELRRVLKNPEIKTHQQGMEAVMKPIHRNHPPEKRSIILAHTFLKGGKISSSERPLSVHEAGEVTQGLFAPFHYTALGHLHPPQTLGTEKTLRYCGSLLKYSLSEVEDQKSFTLVEMDGEGQCTIEEIPISPRRDFRLVEDYFQDLLLGPDKGENPDDYLAISLLDSGALFEPMNRLREVYPNIVHLRRKKMEFYNHDLPRVDLKGKTELQLFESFFSEVSDQPLTPSQEELFKEALRGAREKEL